MNISENASIDNVSGSSGGGIYAYTYSKINIEGGIIKDNIEEAIIKENDDGTYTYSGGNASDITFFSSIPLNGYEFYAPNSYLNISENASIDNVYSEKGYYVSLDGNYKLSNIDNTCVKSLNNKANEMSWGSAKVSLYLQSELDANLTLSDLSLNNNMPIYALVTKVDESGKPTGEVKALLVTKNEDGSLSVNVPSDYTSVSGCALSINQPSKDNGYVKISTFKASINEDDLINDVYKITYEAEYTMSNSLLSSIKTIAEENSDGKPIISFTVELDSRLTALKENAEYVYDFDGANILEISEIKTNDDNTITVSCKLKEGWKDIVKNASDIKMTLTSTAILSKNDFEAGETLKTTGSIYVKSKNMTIYMPANVCTTNMLAKTYDYSLNYDLNGGSFNDNINNETINSSNKSYSFTIIDVKPTRTAYKFLGWSRSSNASTATYFSNDVITLYNDNPTLTLYAVWEKEETLDPTPSIVTPSTPSSDDNLPLYEPCPDGLVWDEDVKACVAINPNNNRSVVINNAPSNDNDINNPSDDISTPIEDSTNADEIVNDNANEEVIIEENETPLVGNDKSWAILNLVGTILTIILGFILIFSKQNGKDNDDSKYTRLTRYKVLAIISTIASIVIFVLTEDITSKIVLSDKWTLLTLAMLAINVTSLIFGRKWHKIEEFN